MVFQWMKKWVPVGAVPEVGALDLHRRIVANGPLFLVDVRTQAEWRRSHIAGARSLPITQLSGAISTLTVEPSALVVVICRSAHRSIPAVRLLREHGHSGAVQLAGGMLAWWTQSLPVEGNRHED